MRLTFTGTGSCLPENDQADTASFLINRDTLVDAGWFTVRNLLRAGIDPGEIRHIFFTHMHQDHYLGLAHFLFYRMNRYHTLSDLFLYGPEGLQEILDRALMFAGFDRIHGGKNRETLTLEKPCCTELPKEGDIHTENLAVAFTASRHAVPGRMYRFTDANDKSIVITGDTASLDKIPSFAYKCNLLVHEAAFGAETALDANLYFHSNALQAAGNARAAQAEQLFLVHCVLANRKAALQTAQKIFPASHFPIENEAIEL